MSSSSAIMCTSGVESPSDELVCNLLLLFWLWAAIFARAAHVGRRTIYCNNKIM